MNPMKKLMLALAIVGFIAVPAKAEFVTSLKPNVGYKLTMTRGADNADATAVILFAVSGNGVTVLDTQFVLGTPDTPDEINFTLGKRVNVLIIQASPSINGQSAPGVFSYSVTNTVTGAVIVPTTVGTGDHQLVFNVVP